MDSLIYYEIQFKTNIYWSWDMHTTLDALKKFYSEQCMCALQDVMNELLGK